MIMGSGRAYEEVGEGPTSTWVSAWENKHEWVGLVVVAREGMHVGTFGPGTLAI